MDKEKVILHAKRIAGNVVFIILVLILGMLIRNYVISLYMGQDISMEPTSKPGSIAVVNKFIYFFKIPERGDIVIFSPPQNGRFDFVKRVVGLPGDKIEIKNGALYVNDEVYPEKYIKELMNYNYGPIVVPQNQVFVLGDNRNYSSDSHIWGCLPLDKLKGKVILLFPPLRFRFVESLFRLLNGYPS